MPRYLKINILCILFLALSFPAASELYQYIDENGIMRLTDTIYSVPVGQRAQLEQFDEFEDLSNEISILPIPDKPVPQTTDQTKVKKNITPKTAKEISAETEKNIIHPDAEKKIVSESKEKTTDPFQPIFSEKPIEEPDAKVSPKQLHKSEKVTIRRIDKKTPSQTPALIETPEKNIKKKTEPRKTPKADPESIIVRKDQSQTTIAKKPTPIPEIKTESKKMTPAKDIADAEKAITASKATQLKPEKSIQKSAGPDTIKPDVIKLKTIKPDTTKTDTTKPVITKKPAPKTPKKVVQVPKEDDSQKTGIEPTKIVKKNPIQEIKPKTQIKPDTQITKKEPSEKITSQKSEPIPDSKTKKTTQPKIETVDQKTATDAKMAKREPEKNINKSTRPVTQETVTKEETHTEIRKEIARLTEKTTEIESVQHTNSPIAVKKEIIAQKPEPTPDSNLNKSTPPKIVTADQKTASNAKATKKDPLEIEATTVPQIKTTETDKPVSSQAEKDLDSLIAANKKDSKKLTETKKVESDTRETTSKESELFINAAQTEHAVTTVTESQVIETDNSKVTQKDESIVLAKLESTRKTLSNKKEALNKKFMALMKEKQEIEDNVDEDDEKSVLQYNENVKKLNFKIKQYKTEKKFLQAGIEKYNHAIKQSALN